MKIAVIGSGSTYTPELAEGILKRKDSLPVTELWLMDIDERKRTIVGNLVTRMAEKDGRGIKVILSDDLDRSLDGADYVLGQIRVGKLPARVLDEKIPLKYNLIGQETCGIGGFFKAMRTVPVILDMARRMEKLCPDTWFINFSNPSGILAEALLNHTKIRAMGLCNGPIGMMTQAKDKLGLTNPEFTYIGLNHLGFLTSIRENGVDYLEQALQSGAGSVQMQNIPGGLTDEDFLRMMGAIPSAYLQYYTQQEDKLKKLKSEEKSRGEVCIELEEQLLEMYSDVNLSEKPALLDKRGGHLYSEAAIALVDAIHNDRQETHVVNVKNAGAIDFMHADDVVECCAVVGKTGAEPVPVKGYANRYVIGMMRLMKEYEKLAVEAAMEGSEIKALRALMLNPLLHDFAVTRACFRELLEAHRNYLPKFFS